MNFFVSAALRNVYNYMTRICEIFKAHIHPVRDPDNTIALFFTKYAWLNLCPVPSVALNCVCHKLGLWIVRNITHSQVHHFASNSYGIFCPLGLKFFDIHACLLSPHHPDMISQRSQTPGIVLWWCSLNPLVFVFPSLCSQILIWWKWKAHYCIGYSLTLTLTHWNILTRRGKKLKGFQCDQ